MYGMFKKVNGRWHCGTGVCVSGLLSWDPAFLCVDFFSGLLALNYLAYNCATVFNIHIFFSLCQYSQESVGANLLMHFQS